MQAFFMQQYWRALSLVLRGSLRLCRRAAPSFLPAEFGLSEQVVAAVALVVPVVASAVVMVPAEVVVPVAAKAVVVIVILMLLLASFLL